ncbi:hypothetical protein [Chitinophaga qingshengii]|uniref:ABC transporter permease n=1 Tax=Chitinophaga qingshengii TaxID=1569794 RepID=A0ABR7TFN2_9BACT|nr:hypothetical protein [Chitinophaga qingshengii]MBC9929119.1 hypothetical protein [Chitinophaga qingshengii]
MRRPLTMVLVRLFAHSFYKMHAGLLLFLFVTFVSYAFFINTTGEVPPDLLSYCQQIITITLVSSPYIMVLFFIVCLIYNIKSWQYIKQQLAANEQQFIFYSVNAMPTRRQFSSWFYVQLLINAPAFFYALFAVGIGLIWQHYLLPVLILLYLFLLTTGGAVIHVIRCNRVIDTSSPPSVLLRFTQRWRKPLSSLFIYYILDKKKIAWLITKAVTLVIISSRFFHLLEEIPSDLRVAGLAMLLIVMAHAALIFQEQQFEQYYLGFLRNFPYSRERIFGYSLLTHVLLLLPELSWMLLYFKPATGLLLVFSALGYIQLLRSICYRYGDNMRRYVAVVFVLFMLMFWGIMFGGIWWMLPGSFVVAYLLFYRLYFRQG